MRFMVFRARCFRAMQLLYADGHRFEMWRFGKPGEA